MGKTTKDKRDKFYRLAKEEGWRARSAFKLLQIDEQYSILNGVSRAVDLCAAPGSWSQVLSKRLQGNRADREIDASKIVAVDIQTMAPIDGVTLIQGDITSPETANKVISHFQGHKAQLVVCDGAPDVTGQHDLDEFMQAQLLLAALNITTFIIEEHGTFVAKIFRGKDISLMVAQFRIFFGQVHVVKPKSSRTYSIESFIICSDFQMPIGYEPAMFDMLTTLENNPKLNEMVKNGGASSHIIPFLMCGDLNKFV